MSVYTGAAVLEGKKKLKNSFGLLKWKAIYGNIPLLYVL